MVMLNGMLTKIWNFALTPPSPAPQTQIWVNFLHSTIACPRVNHGLSFSKKLDVTTGKTYRCENVWNTEIVVLLWCANYGWHSARRYMRRVFIMLDSSCIVFGLLPLLPNFKATLDTNVSLLRFSTFCRLTTACCEMSFSLPSVKTSLSVTFIFLTGGSETILTKPLGYLGPQKAQ